MSETSTTTEQKIRSAERDQVDANMLRRSAPSGRRLRVCIVGAGVAGLRAANCLSYNGVDVTVYEARDRVGGRLALSKICGHQVDLGPNWIHNSTASNPIAALAQQTNTRLHFWDDKHIVFDEDGTRVPDADAHEAMATFWDIIFDAYKHSRQYKHTSTIPADQSLMDFVEQRGRERYPAPCDDDGGTMKRKRRLLEREAELWSGYVGSTIRRQSLRFFWMEESLDGDTPFVAGTFARILNAIAAPAMKSAKIQLGRAVTGIDTGDRSDENRGVVVETADGSVEEFDEVLVTCPLGWLKQNKRVFRPPLPDHLTRAIDAIGYGSLDKVYITFPSAFWNKPDDPSTEDSSKISTSIQVTNNATTPTHTSPPNGPDFIQYYQPSYAPTTNPSGWPQEALNLAALGPSAAHPTLLFYIYGACAQHIARLAAARTRTGAAASAAVAAAADTPTTPEAETAVLAFFAPYIARLPHHDPADPACVPVHALATAWAADEWAGYGSYSNFQVGLEDGDGAVAALREGAPERRVWFAGEHVAPVEGLGTVSGAWSAGEEVAKRICEMYGLEMKEAEI